MFSRERDVANPVPFDEEQVGKIDSWRQGSVVYVVLHSLVDLCRTLPRKGRLPRVPRRTWGWNNLLTMHAFGSSLSVLFSRYIRNFLATGRTSLARVHPPACTLRLLDRWTCSAPERVAFQPSFFFALVLLFGKLYSKSLRNFIVLLWFPRDISLTYSRLSKFISRHLNIILFYIIKSGWTKRGMILFSCLFGHPKLSVIFITWIHLFSAISATSSTVLYGSFTRTLNCSTLISALLLYPSLRHRGAFIEIERNLRIDENHLSLKIVEI